MSRYPEIKSAPKTNTAPDSRQYIGDQEPAEARCYPHILNRFGKIVARLAETEHAVTNIRYLVTSDFSMPGEEVGEKTLEVVGLYDKLQDTASRCEKLLGSIDYNLHYINQYIGEIK